MSNRSAKLYVDNLIEALRSGSIQKRPDGYLQGANLNLGLITEPDEVERAILSRDPRAAGEVERFRAALAGKAEALPTANEPVPSTPPPKLAEPTLAERTLTVLQKLTAEVNARLSGN